MCQHAGGGAEVRLLLEEYCSHRSQKRTASGAKLSGGQGSQPQKPHLEGPQPLLPQGLWEEEEWSRSWREVGRRGRDSLGPSQKQIVSFFKGDREHQPTQPSDFYECVEQMGGGTIVPDLLDSSDDDEASGSPAREEEESVADKEVDLPSGSQSSITEQLLRITDSAVVPDVTTDSQDDLVKRLVELLIMHGDNIDSKIQESPALKVHLQNLNYNLFKSLTSTVQERILQASSPDSEEQKRIQSIAWAFEVTSRLSAVSFVHHRRVMNFGQRFIQENHDAWVQDHGGWDRVFDLD